MLYYVLESPPPLWGQGVRWSKGSERGSRGSEGSERGQEGVRGSEINVILGFKAPTISGRKNFDDDI